MGLGVSGMSSIISRELPLNWIIRVAPSRSLEQATIHPTHRRATHLAPMPLIDSVTMSAPSRKTAAAGSGQKTAPTDDETLCRAIPTLPSPLAQAIRHVHPVLLLSLFYLGFGALVRDPVPTLLNSIPAVAALQVAYAVICLPAAGSSAAVQPAKKLRPGEKRKPVADANAPNITSVCSRSLATTKLLYKHG